MFTNIYVYIYNYFQQWWFEYLYKIVTQPFQLHQTTGKNLNINVLPEISNMQYPANICYNYNKFFEENVIMPMHQGSK